MSSQQRKPTKKSAATRQNGDYTAPILTEPAGGPIPPAKAEAPKEG